MKGCPEGQPLAEAEILTREDMYDLIREGKLPEIRAAVTAWFAACAGQYRRGRLTEAEYTRALLSSPFQPDPATLKAGLGLQLRLEEYEHWARLREDRKLWEAGIFPDSEEGAPWLYLAAADREEADPEDRIRFFQLMDAFSVPNRMFEICPPDIPRWRLQFLHEYADGALTAVRTICTDDGGLHAAPNPIGQEYLLRDIDGASVMGRVRSMEFDDHVLEYRFLGIIDGYTSAVPRELRLSFTAEDPTRLRITWFSLREYGDDAVRQDPRWEPYRAWYERKQAAVEAHYRMLADFCRPEG